MDEEFEAPAMAIITGDVEGLRALLVEDPDWATRRSTVGHPTLLQLIACEAKNLENATDSALALIEAGAETHGPLVSAAGCSSHDILKLLLDHGVGVDGEDVWAPLDEAIYWVNRDVIAFLLENNAKVRALSTAAGLGDVAKMEAFFGANSSLLANAGPVASPFPDTVPADLADDPAAIINHAFVMAVNAGQREAAQWLLARGAEVNAIPPGYHWKGTALHAACWRGEEKLVRWLMDEGADPTIHDGLADADAIGWANHHGHPNLVPLLTS